MPAISQSDCSICDTKDICIVVRTMHNTVELPNNGHDGSRTFVLYMEVVPSKKLRCHAHSSKATRNIIINTRNTKSWPVNTINNEHLGTYTLFGDSRAALCMLAVYARA